VDVEIVALAWFSRSREEAMPMPKKRHSEEEILCVLRDVEAGETSVAICRKCRISRQALCLSRKYAGLGLSEIRPSSTAVRRTAS
jgi:hypothetical protein